MNDDDKPRTVVVDKQQQSWLHKQECIDGNVKAAFKLNLAARPALMINKHGCMLAHGPVKGSSNSSGLVVKFHSGSNKYYLVGTTSTIREKNKH